MSYPKAELASNLTSVELVDDLEVDAQFFRKLEQKGIKLNENQIKIARHVDGAVVVDSVAGSGKSTTVATRLAYLIEEKGIDPKNILLITYTKKAAQEMLEKAKNITDLPPLTLDKVTSGTFHSVFLRILKEQGLTEEIWASGKQQEITIKSAMRKEKMAGIEAEEVLALIALQKNKGFSVEEFKPKLTNKKLLMVKKLWEKYEEHKQDKGLIDFNDILLRKYKLSLSDTEFLADLQNRFKYIIIDEGQDTSWLQQEVIKLIAQVHSNVMLVGDIDQTIFTFAGARLQNILNFHKLYPNTIRINLDVNYRSNDGILGLSNIVINDNLERIKKQAKSAKQASHLPKVIEPLSTFDEANFIMKSIRKKVENGEAKYSEFAILYRNNSNSRSVFEELLMENIPFIQYGGSELFYENGIIKPLIDYLRLIIDPKDMKAIKSILPSLYISRDKSTVITSRNKKNPIDYPLEHILDDLKPYQAGKVKERIQLIKRIRSGEYRPLVAVKMLRDEYEQFLIGEENESSTSLQKEIIKETLDEFETSLKRHADIKEYIEYVDKVIKNAEIQEKLQKNPNYDAVKLMTIHRSKGLEFKHVYLITMVDGTMPFISDDENYVDIVSDDELNLIEEERRLLYVGITRAKDYLTISIPKFNRNKPTIPSRFLVPYM